MIMMLTSIQEDRNNGIDDDCDSLIDEGFEFMDER